jgi:DNA (cytosine-5)-methyltransferase 1
MLSTLTPDDALLLGDEFAGLGGGTEGARCAPFVKPYFAANHNKQAVESHQANHPDVEHYEGDVQKIRDYSKVFPYFHIFWASPACPDWTDAKGKKRTFDKANQLALWKTDLTEEEKRAIRSRALMEEVVKYLRAMHDKGKVVLAGVVENVIQCRKWAEWDRWIAEIKALGYEVRVIALNSMHVKARKSPRAPQSRDRLYVAYWHKSLGRTPDWDKWLRPRAWCSGCAEWVDAMQTFKNPKNDMGRYGAQYVYRCPKASCRFRIVEPEVVPAYEAIDWSLPGTPIGDRADDGEDGLAPNTLARIEAGMRKYWAPLLTPTGGTWRDNAIPLDEPMPTRTTRECDGLAVPPLVVPLEGRQGKQAAPADEPIRTQTCRRETGLALPPFMTPMRGGGDLEKAYTLDRHLHAVTAGGFHHGLATAPPLFDPLLVQYYGNGRSIPVSEPVGALPTRDRYALATIADLPFHIDDVLFRMLEPHEIQAAMAFRPDYLVLAKAKRDKVRLLGNAVTPNVSEVLVCALVEAITGVAIDRYNLALAA